MNRILQSIAMATALGILGLAPLAAQDDEPAAGADAGIPADTPAAASDASVSADMPGAPAPAFVEAPVAAPEPAAAVEPALPPATTDPAILPVPAPAEPGPGPATNEPVPPAAPAPDPRAGDRPGWWFQAALRAQPRGYPAFLGARFADATRAVVIEVPARTLAAGRPLDYQVWACNDLPGTLDGRVSCRVERDGAPVAADPPAALRVKGGTVEAVPRARHATGGWAPGEYVIRAALCDPAGAVLHRAAETVTVTSATATE